MDSRIDALRGRLAGCGCEAFVSFSAATNHWLSGFRGSTSAIVVTQSDAIFLNDFRYTEQAATQVKGFTLQEVPGNIQVRAGEKLASLGATSVAFEPGYMTVAELDYVKSAYSGQLKPVPDVIGPLRMVKSKEEVDTIRAAGQLAEGVLADLIEDLKPGITERQLAARFEFEFKARGASGASFDTIAAFGPKSSLPHAQPGDKPLERGDIVLLDFGCRLNGYCSDLTRTFAFGTIPGAWFEEIYHLTLTAQRRALEAVGPGKPCREVDAIARDIITQGGHGKHFGHGLGHGVGIEIHESPRLNPESSAVLAPGMIVTVEPGIYLPGQGGVRIEDLVVVTEDGCENLSKAPKELRILGT